MAELELDTDKGLKYRRLRIKLVIANVILIGLLLFLFYIPWLIPTFVFLILIFLFVVNILIIIWSTKKYYNWTLTFIGLILFAIFSRRMRWPTAAFSFFAGFTGLEIISFISDYIFLIKYKHNGFLRYIGFASSIVLAMVANGLLFKNLHWANANVMLNLGLILFIPFLFAFIFTLPGSNYVSWKKSDRLIFYRSIIIPMSFVFVLCVLMFALPDLWTSINRSMLMPFEMFPFDILPKPGLF